MMTIILRRLLQGVLELKMNPWAQLMTLAAVTLIAFLGGLFLLVLHNINEEMLRIRGDVLFQVYWEPGADMERVRAQWGEFSSLPHLLDQQTFTPDQALNALSQSLGEAVDLSWLKDRQPLPATALLSFAPRLEEDADNAAWSQEMLSYFKELPGVATVRYNPLRSELMGAWSKLSDRVLWPLIVFLVVVVGLVVGNTIKLSQLFRQDEIDILRTVGAREWYIHLPLVAGGVAQGLAGGAAALCMLKLVQLALKNVLNFPPFFFQFAYLPFSQVALLLGVLATMGLFASCLAVRR